MNANQKRALQNNMNAMINTQLGMTGTSHHARRFVNVVFDGQNKPSITLRAGTWNLMKRCLDKNSAGSPVPNNPFLIFETETEYSYRKHLQILSIMDDLNDKKLDCYFLQEADFMFESTIDPIFEHSKENLRKTFVSLLEQSGYGFVATKSNLNPMSDGVKYQQPLVTLYRKTTLQPDPSMTLMGGLPDSNKRYRSSTSFFLHCESKERFALMNAHLNHNDDYTNKIDIALDQYKDQNIFLLAGGDMAHSPAHLERFITSDTPSCVAPIRASQKLSQASLQPFRCMSSLSSTVPSQTEYLKINGKAVLCVKENNGKSSRAHDGFFVTPIPSYETTTTIFDVESIELSNDSLTAYIEPIQTSNKKQKLKG